MTESNSNKWKSIFLVHLLILMTCTTAISAQSEGHSTIHLDFGVWDNEICNIENDVYLFEEIDKSVLCIQIDFSATSNTRFNLSFFSETYTGFYLENIELLITPNMNSIQSFMINFDVPLDMDYGKNSLSVIISDWNPTIENIPEPILNTDEHFLEIRKSLNSLPGDFLTERDEIIVSQFGFLNGVLRHNNNHLSPISVKPVLVYNSLIIAEGEDYLIGSQTVSNQKVSFELPTSIGIGEKEVNIALKDVRNNDLNYIWSEAVDILVVESYGDIDISYAYWDIQSFNGPSMLATFPNDEVGVIINSSNHGSLVKSSEVWINLDSGMNCYSILLGVIQLGNNDVSTYSYSFIVPNVGHGTRLAAKISTTSNCLDEGVELEPINVFDWPVSVTGNIHKETIPQQINGNENIGFSFSLTNLENRTTPNLNVSIKMFALGKSIGSWESDVQLLANETRLFQSELQTDYCYDGIIDSTIEINNNDQVIFSSTKQNSSRVYFSKGDFEITSSVINGNSVSLGYPIIINSQIHAQINNPDCKLLIPLQTLFEPINIIGMNQSEISLIELESGETISHDIVTTISSLTGEYKVSQHLLKTWASNIDINSNFIESSIDFAEIEIIHISPDFLTDCQKPSLFRDSINTLEIICSVENINPFLSKIRMGIDIDGIMKWTNPSSIEAYDEEKISLIIDYDSRNTYSNIVKFETLWDGSWLDIGDNSLSYSNIGEEDLGNLEIFPNKVATTYPLNPIAGEPFSLRLEMQGTSDWLGGTYEVRLWTDESKEGSVYFTQLDNNLNIGQKELLEIEFEKWPHNCGLIPYQIISRDAGGIILESINSEFIGCNFELIDLALVGEIEVKECVNSCSLDIKVQNIGNRDYVTDEDEEADITLIIDGLVEKSSTTVPELKVGEEAVISLGISRSGFKDIRVILDGDKRYSEINRDNNGLGWSSPSGPILFNNDSDFDGLPNLLEESGYVIRIIDNRMAIKSMIVFSNDRTPENAEKARQLMTEIQVYPSQYLHDTDADGLSDLKEYLIKSNPQNPDTDGDGYSDYEEYLMQTEGHDMLVIDTVKPTYELFETIETEHPVENSDKKILNFRKEHTREFMIEDRNLDLDSLTVKIKKINQLTGNLEEKIIPNVKLLSQNSDSYHFIVSYEYPGRLAEYSVNVSVNDAYGNVLEFDISNQDNIWGRATSKISALAIGHLATPIFSPILGFMTGVIYGLKDIYEFSTGIVKFILNYEEILGSIKQIIDLCTPELELPIRSPSECPIDIKELGKELIKGILDINPYDEGTASGAIFLLFAMWGFVAVSMFFGNVASKIFDAARTASKTIDNIAQGLSSAVTTITNNAAGLASAVINLGSKGLKTGLPGVIYSLGASIINALIDITSYVIGIIFTIIFLPAKLITEFRYTFKFIFKALNPPNSKNLEKIASPAYYKPIMMKDSILKDLNSKRGVNADKMTFEEFSDGWLKHNRNDAKREWYVCQKIYPQECVSMDHKTTQIADELTGEKGREVDGKYISDSGNTVIIENKHITSGEKPYQTMTKDDIEKSKSGKPRSSGGDIADDMTICDGLSEKLCSHTQLSKDSPDYNKGLTEEEISYLDQSDKRPAEGSGFNSLDDAQNAAKNIKEGNPSSYELRYDIPGIEKYQPCRLNQACKTHFENKYSVEKYGSDAQEYMENAMKVFDASSDMAGPIFSQATTPGIVGAILIMSGEIGFVEENNERERNYIFAIFIGISAIFSSLGAGLYYKKKRKSLSKI